MLTLLKDFVQRQDTILDLTRQLVQKESTSRDEVRLNLIGEFVAERARSVASRVQLIPSPGYGSHLLAEFDLGHPPDSPQTLLLGHLDTVWPAGTLERLPFRVTDEGTAHGPGIFDMKAGIAMALTSLETIVTSRIPARHRCALLLTCDEEIGSKSSRALIEDQARKSTSALVLEPPVPGGIVKTGRKGVGVFTLRVTGRAAHAGLDPTKGINAIVEMAHQAIRLAELNDYERGITVNVGVAEGGTTSNVVPATASAKIDFRFWALEDGRMIEAVIRGLQPVIPGARLEVSGGINRPPMERSAANLALFDLAHGLASEIGFELKEQTVGGGSDGNFTAALGIPTLDGLGIDGAGAHAENEHIVVSDIPRRSALLTALITRA